MMKLLYRVIFGIFILGVSLTPILSNPKPVLAVADRYWVGNAGNWSDTAHWAAASGGAGGQSVPTSANDVHFDANSFTAPGQFVTLGLGHYYCRSMDWTGAGVDTPYLMGTRDASSPSSLHIYNGLTLDAGVTPYFIGSSGTYPSFYFETNAQTVTCNGVWAGWWNAYVNTGANAVTMADNLSVRRFTNQSGTVNVGAFSLTTFTDFTGRGQTYTGTVIFYLAPPADQQQINTLDGGNTFTNLNVTHDEKTDVLRISGNQTITGTLTLAGISATNRLFIQSDSSTQRTLTAANVVVSHTDFYSIVGAGAGDWDLSDAGEDTIDFTNNSGITFTYPYSATRDYYWTGLGDGVAGSGSWGVTATEASYAYNWSTTSGGVGGAGRLPPPVSGNSVFFDANSGFTGGNQTVTVYDNVYCDDMDFTGSGAAASAIIYFLGDAKRINVYGDITFISGMQFNRSSGLGYLDLRGSGDFDSAAITIDDCNVTVNSTGTYVLLDSLVMSGFATYTFTTGGIDTNGETIYVYKSGGTANFYGGAQTYDHLYVSLSSDARTYIRGANTFVDLTVVATDTGFANTISFDADMEITDTITLQGYDCVHQMQVGSSALGTQRQITAADGTITACLISDIAGVGAWDWDISAGCNSDGGNNLGITFTTPIYCYWVGNSASWSNSTHWASTSGGTGGTARVPLIQDTAVFDVNSFTIPGRVVTIDVTNLGGIDATTALYVPTISKAGTVDIHGHVDIGTITYNVTTTNMKGFDTVLASESVLNTNLYILKTDMYMATLYLGSDVEINGTVYVRSGVFNHNGYNLTAGYYDSTTTTYERQILLGGGVTTLQGTASGNKWAVGSTNLTLVPGESTIILTNSGTNGQTFAGGNLIYNDLTITGAGVYTTTISGTNTLGTLLIDRSSANKTISGSVTMTLTDPSGFSMPLAGTKTITITNTDFSMASGVVLGDYLVISGSSASGGANFFASVGGHSTNNGGNSGWIWTPPTAPTIQTLDASDVTYLGERLNGELLTAGSYVTFYCYFEYGPTVAYGFTTVPENILTAPGTFNNYLSPYKVYHYRAVVRFGLNDHAYGNDKTVSITGGVQQARAAVSDPAQEAGTALVSSVPTEPSRMYTEGDTGGIPIAPLVNPALAGADIPEAVFWYPIAFLVALIVGFVIYSLTKSLLVQAITSAMIMAAFCGGGVLGDGLLPYWTVLVFIIEAVCIWLIQEKQTI